MDIDPALGTAHLTEIAVPPTQIEEVRRWNVTKLVEFVQRELELDSDDAEKLKNAKIDGAAFLLAAGQKGIFQEVGIPLGPSLKLAHLAKTINDTADTKRKALENEPLLAQPRQNLEIRPYGPLRPGDPVLQISPINRKFIPSILKMAEITQMPAIIHGPYQCGKTSLLYAISEDLSSRGYDSFFIDLDDAIFPEEFSVERFYQEISIRVFKKRMGKDEFISHFEYAYRSKKTPKKTAFFLFDEMQCMIASNTIEWAVRGFCKLLDMNGIPWIGVGTSELRELAWKMADNQPLHADARSLGSPFNRAQFALMPRIDYNEAMTLFKTYEKARQLQIPDIVKHVIMREAAGHPSSFMTLMKMFDKNRPDQRNWPRKLLMSFEKHMNGLPSKLDDYLQHQGPRELVQKYVTSGNRQWPMNIMALTADERSLFNKGILTLVSEDDATTDRERLVGFTSGLVFRICIHAVFPKRNMRLSKMLPPIQLLENAIRHLRPSQLGIKMAWNLRGPAEHIFQVEMYSVFRDLLPAPWLCASEVHVINSEGKDGNSSWRLDLLLLADTTESLEDTSSSRDINPKSENGVGFELKVDKVTKNEIDDAIHQAIKYAKSFNTDIYLVNFLSKLSRPPEAAIIKERDVRVFLVNVTYNDSLNEFQVRYVEESSGGNLERGIKVYPAGNGIIMGPTQERLN